MANKVFDNIIDPIKLLRRATFGEVTLRTNDAGELVIDRAPSWSLKDSKDFVEACMAMGVRRHLEEQLRRQREDAFGVGRSDPDFRAASYMPQEDIKF